MDIGVVSFAATSAAVGDEPPISDADRMAFLLDEIEGADQAGLDGGASFQHAVLLDAAAILHVESTPAHGWYSCRGNMQSSFQQ
jgi:hypothetical protein